MWVYSQVRLTEIAREKGFNTEEFIRVKHDYEPGMVQINK